MEDMSLPAEEYQRLLFFESARDKAAETYQHAPEDSDNLTRWGGALLELSQIQQGKHSLDLVKDAVSKLEEARNINPLKSDALWCLGNAYTTHGFLIHEGSLAKDYFQKASGCFLQALELEPNNELFQKALEMSAKAPALHEELQSQLTAQPDHFDAAAGVPERGHTLKGKKKRRKNDDFKYDLLGWVVLAVGVIAWISFSKAPPEAPETNIYEQLE
ncbi:hypothetical protein GOP47_0013935 [Adiantum capillus-veneris]|uniref:Mitochondrial import receptor subunit TOM20 n=1 Tax=Adiantum capillus-veneris TaxID=13818 RepID=A0A9D4UPZ0_ADICA|nr:hypothetical protein GOP47_0013935 [Adiantum capillus-veneris]